MNFKIYHNPRCSKSRQTLDLLQQNNIQPEVIEYLSKPLTHDELNKILNLLDKEPLDIIRTKEPIYSELKLENFNRDDLIQAIIDHPILLERPIVITKNAAAIGRPPENILKILPQ